MKLMHGSTGRVVTGPRVLAVVATIAVLTAACGRPWPHVPADTPPDEAIVTRVVPDSVLHEADTADALRLFATGDHKGKIIITMV